ncbi:MAG: anaerobic ribonucleoside-triphosphate reductase activating protein [Proteobacteria bacterium]|nr:anaerobic ribonucleoside-triphosphate reductase activating protein [Pseudomonadota bacterium]
MPSSLRVGGLTRFTSIDYPGKLSAVVFVQGCPWRCGYCHNPQLQSRDAPAGPAWREVMAWLPRRVGLIDAVVFSGGEPTLDPALGDAMGEVRALGLAVGLHSAGIYPRRLRELLPRLDWIGLDVKAPLDDEHAHRRITGVAGSAEAVAESVRAVLEAGVACEMRTTAHPALLADAELRHLADGLAAQGATHFALQVARPANHLPAAPADYPAPATLAHLRAAFPNFSLRRE